MKNIIFFCFFCSFSINSFAQIRIGDTIPGFYHATYNPVYKVQDLDIGSSQQEVSIDIDGDGANDLSLVSNYFETYYSHGGTNFYYEFWGCNLIYDSLTEVITINNSTQDILDTLHYNDLIDNTNNWTGYSTNAPYAPSGGFCFVYSNGGSAQDTWKDQSFFYVGLRLFKTTGDTLYGWLSVSIEDYNIIYLKESACQSFNPRDTIISLFNSINDDYNFSNETISAYPNPFPFSTILHSKIYLYNVTLTMVNCLGQTVKRIENLNGQTINLYRDNLPNGIYFIRLLQNNKVISTSKLIITDY